LLIVACGSEGTPIPTLTPVGSSAGQRLFIANGCAACHGSDGMGSVIAPGLFDHSTNQIIRQVRAQLGAMPAFGPSKISDSELDDIAEYIQGLGVSGGHADVEMTDRNLASFQHHWMALLALEDGSLNDAVHHIDHIIEVATGPHLSQMIKVKEEIATGRIHEGIHTIQTMLIGTAGAGLTPLDIHPGLARSSINVGDLDDVSHHLDHILEDVNGGTLTADVAEIRRLLELGELADATNKLQALMDK